MIKRVPILLLSLILISVIIRVYKIDYPISLKEAKESYTAYSIIKTGLDTNGNYPKLWFKSDNNYLSTLGVYLRIPTIYFFDLSFEGTRIPNVIIVVILVYVFYLLAKSLLRSYSKSLIVCLILTFSLLFINISIFDLGKSSALLFLLLSFYLINKNKYALLITSILAILSDITSFPIAISLMILNMRNFGYKTKAINLTIIALISIIILKSNPNLDKFLERESVILDIKPSSYAYLIERRLSFGQVAGSSLITTFGNFNRLAHNKVFYFFNEFFKQIIKPFDYEKLSSAFQASTILDKEPSLNNKLSNLFFWEIPVILIGLISLFKRINKEFKVYSIMTFITIILFKGSTLIYALPLIIFAETNFLFSVKKLVRNNYGRLLVFILLPIVILSFISFFDLLWFHNPSWINEFDLRQYQIWSKLSTDDLNQKKTKITDRLGEPAFYYLYYMKVDPLFFQNTKVLGPTISSGLERIESIGKISFGSFKYGEDNRKKYQIWIGISGEFEKNIKESEISTVTEGKIIIKIKDIKQENQFIGTELWFVRTDI